MSSIALNLIKIFSLPLVLAFGIITKVNYFTNYFTIILGILLYYLILSIVIVQQNNNVITEILGKFNRVVKPGLQIIPFGIENIVSTLDIRECLVVIPTQTVISKDNASVEIDGIAFYQIINPKDVVYTLQDFQKSLDAVLMTNLRTISGSLEVDEMLSKRSTINQRLLEVLDEITDTWGIKVIRVEIKHISPQEDVLDSMAQQIKSERERRSLILEAEGTKRAQILKAEGEKESTILKAQAEQEAALLKAESIYIIAESECRSLSELITILGQDSDSATKFILGKRYIDALEKLHNSTNSKLIIIPLELSQLTTFLSQVVSTNNHIKEENINSKEENIDNHIIKKEEKENNENN
jgi:regulator of protease activity HflC (stomatin/prohibitin superfamily)